MKRLLAFTLSLVLLLATLPAASAQGSAPTSITVATPTEMSGCFYSDLWGVNASDMDVRGLIHGYGTVALQQEGNYAVDSTVVAALETSADESGNQQYRFTLQPDLRWNNGDAITVQDYLFTILLESSPELAALGVSNEQYAHLLGWEAFSQNSSAPFSGVRIVDDRTFTLTVKAENLPFFYELMLLQVQPTPISVVAPGFAVVDDGEGAFMSAVQGQTTAFSSDLLQETLLGENGYVHRPTVTCGSFSLTDYNPETQVAQFDKNTWYKGNYEGQVSEVEHITFCAMPTQDMLTALSNGTVDIVNKLSNGEAIDQGLAMVREGQARTINYMRSGFGFLGFACEDATTADNDVRKAVAMCMDTDEICNITMNGYALPVYGYYGLDQWMAFLDTERLSALNKYGYDPIGAKALLAEAGWTYDQRGGSFTEGTDTVRYKRSNGSRIPLSLRVAIGQGNVAAEVVSKQLTAAAQTLGAELTITELPLSELLSHYYRQTERTYNLFLLGTNFSHMYDPYYAFHTGNKYQGITNTTGLRDEQLMQLALELRSVENSDVEAYGERWFAFQERWVELLPMVPLYSNVYFDFTRPDLYNYRISAHWGWSAAILYATFTQPQETEMPQVEATPQP